MPRTFMQRVEDAQAEVPVISIADAERRLREEPNAVVIDVRDAADIRASGIIPGGHHVSLGTLLFKADHSLPEAWRDPVFADKDRPILTTCQIGAMASIAAKELKDLGYTNVSIIDGGTDGWTSAGRPTEPFQG
ncbi:MAG: rhodanese-like domain-containing protein [Thermomicrobiales bacterium]